MSFNIVDCVIVLRNPDVGIKYIYWMGFQLQSQGNMPFEFPLYEYFFCKFYRITRKTKSSSKILAQAWLDLMTSDFPVLHSTTELNHQVLSARFLAMLYWLNLTAANLWRIFLLHFTSITNFVTKRQLWYIFNCTLIKLYLNQFTMNRK